MKLDWFTAVGLTGQVLFTVRTMQQWWLSERAGRTVVPASFWFWSVLGNVLLCVYAAHKQDPVFLIGPIVNLALALRLWWLRSPNRRTVSGPFVVLTALLLSGLVLLALARTWRAEHGSSAFSGPWLAMGLVGQFLWSGRFVVQWWQSERRGRSGLSTEFFALSAAGALLLFAYALREKDLVFVLAYATAPIPYLRNLWLILRPRSKDSTPLPPPTGAPEGSR